MKDRIQEIRKDEGLSMRAFGNKIGISGEAVRLLENGSTKPAERTIRDICEKFSVNREWLMNGEEPKRKQSSTNTSLDALAAANNIDPVTRAIVEGLIEMPAQTREAFIDLIFDISDRIRNSDYEAARPEAVAATASKYFKNFNAAKAENPPEEDRRDLQEPHTV